MEVASPNKPTVIIADDHAAYLERIAKIIAKDFEIVAVASDGQRGVDASLKTPPDILLLDISMPGLDGFEVAREIRSRGLKSKVVFVTVHEEPDFMESAMHSGADGYVFKSRLDSDLRLALKTVVAGGKFVSGDNKI